MIWKTEHINPSAKSSPLKVQQLIYRNLELTSTPSPSFSIGIVGGGPKGMYALEELIRQMKDEKLNNNLRVYWWNETINFGSGPNYQIDQADFLLINYCIGHVDAWDKTNDIEENQLNLMEWIEKNKIIDKKVQPTDFASRALLGYYLQNTLLEIISSKPNHLEIILIPEKVENVHIISHNHLKVETIDHEFQVNNLLLATGHCYQNTPLIQSKNDEFSNKYFNSAYPVTKLNSISTQSKVGIIGWGLTFIDVALALTEGRGGTFDKEGNYISSGEEPTLLPFSRNQLPIMPRGPIYGDTTYQLHFINEHWVRSLQAISKDRKIDFSEDILPTLERELKFAFYSTLLQTRDEIKVESYIQTLAEEEVFSYKKLLFPNIPKASNVQNSYINYLAELITEAEKGELKSPLMAAAAVWREASPLISKLYASGGFTGQSQNHLDKKLFGAFCRTSYGPPIENMKKILALLKAGIIKTYWKDEIELNYDEIEKHFILKNSKHQEEVDFIIDARIARPKIQQNNQAFYQNLLENQIIKPFDNEGYQPGNIDMDLKGKIIHPQNIPLYLYGTNTEGVLLDNDSLSRKKNNLAPLWVDEIIHQLKSLK